MKAEEGESPFGGAALSRGVASSLNFLKGTEHRPVWLHNLGVITPVNHEYSYIQGVSSIRAGYFQQKMSVS